MDDALVQAYARLTVHEFAIEMLMANWLASMPDTVEDEFIHEWKERSRNLWAAGDPAIDEETVHRILRDIVELTEHFAEKARRRAREIREARARRR